MELHDFDFDLSRITDPVISQKTQRNFSSPFEHTMKKTQLTHSRRHRGFTLVEVLVTIAIVSVLAGVLLPALFNQLGAGDAGRLATDLRSLRTGVETFGSDVHRLPANITQLITPITASDADINAASYTAPLIARWKGPYVARDFVAATGGGTFSNTFILVTGTNNTRYLSVNVSAMAPSDFFRIEGILDEGNTSSSTSSTTGTLRYSTTNSTLTYMMVPIPSS